MSEIANVTVQIANVTDSKCVVINSKCYNRFVIDRKVIPDSKCHQQPLSQIAIVMMI